MLRHIARRIERLERDRLVSAPTHPPDQKARLEGFERIHDPIEFSRLAFGDRKSTRLNSSQLHLVCRLLLEKKKHKKHRTLPCYVYNYHSVGTRMKMCNE